MVSPQSSSRSDPSIIFVGVLIGVSAMNPLAMNMFLPSMPSMVAYFQSSPAAVQLTLSLYLLASAVSMLIAGPVSDKVGRRPVLLIGLSLFLVGTLICIVSQTLPQLISGRVVQAVGGATGMTLSRAIIRDLFPRDRAASMMGYVTMGMAVAPMAGPLIGGLLHEAFNWRASFEFTLVVGVIVLAFAWLNLTETNHRTENKEAAGRLLTSFATLFGYKTFWLYSLTNLFCSGVFFAFIGGAPFVAEQLLGMSPWEYGLYFMLMVLGYIFGNFLTGRFSGRLGINIMVTAGNLCALVGLTLISTLFALGYLHPLSLFGPMMLIGIANGLTMPNAMAGIVSVRPDLAGAAAGLAGSMQIGAGAMATILVGWLLNGQLWPGTIWPMMLFMMASGTLALVTGQLARSETERTA
ncbi:MAG: multidrug effflux MFS transporter [Stappiaceae bacterium]